MSIVFGPLLGANFATFLFEHSSYTFFQQNQCKVYIFICSLGEFVEHQTKIKFPTKGFHI